MPSSTTWPGTDVEIVALLGAADRHCTCRYRRDRLVGACPAHEMLSHPRIVHGLVFARRIADRLLAEEFASTEPRSAR